MSFRQIFDRISRLARTTGFDARGSFDEDLRRAEELIEQERLRDKAKASNGSTGNSGDRTRDGDSDREPLELTIEQACKVLGVQPDATLEQISSAYRKQIVDVHPDRHVAREPSAQDRATLRTQELNQAYSLLKRRAAERRL